MDTDKALSNFFAEAFKTAGDTGGKMMATPGTSNTSVRLATAGGASLMPPQRDPFKKIDCDPRDAELPRVEVSTRPKFAPRVKSTKELHYEKQITAGPRFDELLKPSIYMDGGSGRKVPCATSFDECYFGPEVMANIGKKKWSVPTAIQSAVIPMVKLKRNDLVVHATTGSGKTAACLLPIIDELVSYKQQTVDYRQKQMFHPYVIMVAPTKELAEQLFNECRALAEGTDVRVVRTYGDTPMGTSKMQVARGCDIFIATGGRLLHFVQDSIIRLGSVRYMILDEADILLRSDMIDNIRLVLEDPSLNPERRLFLFSATFSPQALQIANELLRPHYFIVQAGEANRTAMQVHQEFHIAGRYEKQALLLSLLQRSARMEERFDGAKYLKVPKTMIFVQHRREANRLAVCLAMNGYCTTNITGDRTLRQRYEAIDTFKRGVHDILVANNVAARGLNIPDVMQVINYDLPESDSTLDGYVHRVGRTGRVGNEGCAISFFDPAMDCRFAGYYIEKLQEVGQHVPRFLYEIASGTVVGMRLMKEHGGRLDVFAKFNAHQRYLRSSPGPLPDDGDGRNTTTRAMMKRTAQRGPSDLFGNSSDGCGDDGGGGDAREARDYQF